MEPTQSEIPNRLLTPTFVGFVLTQFLGAFNDNYFKQMVALTCVAQVSHGGADWQPFAMGAFALPFVLLSGFAGYLADRYSKQRIIVLCKAAEVGVMAMTMGVLLAGFSDKVELVLLIVVLGLMGAHSAFFGPAKYGSLPELFQSRHLLPVNGAVQMTTFLAIILGTAAGGFAMDRLGDDLWEGSAIAVGIAVAGVFTSLFIRKLRAAQPKLRFSIESLAIPRDIWALFRNSRDLRLAMLVSTTFWFVGGVTQPVINIIGKEVLGLSDTRTSLLAASIAIGISGGCIAVGLFGKSSGRRWVNSGAYLFVVVSVLIFGLTRNVVKSPPPVSGELEPLLTSILTAGDREWILRCCMAVMGFSAGMIVVPVQVFLQQSPPSGQKGRMIGTQNFLSWVGILASAVFLGVFQTILRWTFSPELAIAHQNCIFLCLAGFMLPIALFYRLGMAESQGRA